MSDQIVVDSLRKRYGQRDVLEDVSLNVPAGSIYALLGKNGAGKSTLLNCLLGLIPATGGRMSIDGAPVNWSTFERLSYVPETCALYDDLTVIDHLRMFAGQIKHFDQRFGIELVTRFELDSRARIGSLSKGHKTALAVLLAFASHPAIAILDEPTAGLDPMAQRRVLDLIVTANTLGATVLLSSHNIGQLERIADHIAILHGGRIQLAGDLPSLLSRHHVIEATFVEGAELPNFGSDRCSVERINNLVRIHVNGDVDRVESSLVASGVPIVHIQDCSLEDIYISQVGSTVRTENI